MHLVKSSKNHVSDIFQAQHKKIGKLNNEKTLIRIFSSTNLCVKKKKNRKTVKRKRTDINQVVLVIYKPENFPRKF